MRQIVLLQFDIFVVFTLGQDLIGDILYELQLHNLLSNLG